MATSEAVSNPLGKAICARCKQPAMGYAVIGDLWYCHGDYDPGPTCYEQQSHEEARERIRQVLEDPDMDENERMLHLSMAAVQELLDRAREKK